MRPDLARPSEQETFSQSELEWRRFSEETKDRLDALFRVLTKRHKEAWGQDEVIELLRLFQLIKDSFFTMALPSGEAIAQRSADLLAAVREGRAVLDDPLLGLLQRAADRLKDMRAYVVARRKDAPPAMALTAELDLLRATLSGSAEAAVAPPVASAVETAPVICVHDEMIDGLMTQIGDMRANLSGMTDILHGGRIGEVVQNLRRFGIIGDGPAASHLREQADIIENDLRRLRSFAGTLEKAHRRLWETSVQVTAVAIEPLLRRLARSARDFAQTQGKEVDVAVDAAGIRIEKTMLEALADPLMQLVQYAVDSGIELPDDRRVAGKPVRGRLMLSAVEVGSKLRITIGDDGRGIDKTRVLSSAMERGLLTAEDAAGLCDREIYGLIFKPRGQAGSARAGGIEGVAARVQELSGAIEVRTTIGRDCHVVVTIPLAAVLLRTLLVRAAEQVFALPERQIICVADADSDDIERVDGQSYYRCRDVAVPLHPLDRLLGFARPDDGRNDGRKYGQIVILSTGTHLIGVHLDEVLRLEDLYLKELHPMLAALPAVAGTAVLGSGRAVLVLDAKGLLELSRPSADKSVATGS